MARKLVMQGNVAWLKTYPASRRSRRLAIFLWNLLVKRLRITPLRAAPIRSGEETRKIEQSRIEALRQAGVLVPEVLGEGSGVLLLGNIGPSLSGCLKDARDAIEVDSLVRRATAALIELHRLDVCLSDAFARNICVTEDRIGFIDFEDDPLEVMSLVEAKARDWLLFTSSIARHYTERDEDLVSVLREHLPQIPEAVAREVGTAATRLDFVPRITRHLGHRAQALGVAVRVLQASFGQGASNTPGSASD